MDPRELEALAQRLGENANDTEALNAAYAYGQQDPRSYAVFLEKAGAASHDPAMGAHWFCEAANVWTASLSDAHRSERALIRAIDKDPLSPTATDRLVASYKEKGNVKGVAALHARRAKGVEKQLAIRPDLKPQLAEVYAELARVFVEELNQPERAIEAYKRAAANNPADAYSIYQARELLKAAGRLKEAVPLFAAEQALIQEDLERRAALYADEIDVCQQLGDSELIIEALRGARSVDRSDDPSLKQQLGATILELVQSGQERSIEDVLEAVEIFVELAETYDGEHGHSYALCALGLEAGNDRAAQLAMYYGQQIGREEEAAHSIAAYLAANPNGAVADQARELVARQLSAGIDDELVAALTPPKDAPPAIKASAYAVIARAMAAHGRESQAQSYYGQVVALSPGDPEAVTFLAGTLRGKKPRELRDLLLAAASVEPGDVTQRHAWLQEVAELCEGVLRDVDGAIEARRQLVILDPTDVEAADQLEETLHKAKKWAELAELLLRRAELEDDPSLKIERAMRAGEIHRVQLGDKLAAGNAYAWAGALEPENTETATLAVDHFLAAQRSDRACEFLEEILQSEVRGPARALYSRRFAELLEQDGRILEAAGAFAEAASQSQDAELWARAQRCFVQGQSWEQAARSAGERCELLASPADKAAVRAEQADYLFRLGDSEGALDCLRQSLDLNPEDEEVAALLEGQYEELGRYGELVSLCLSRASSLGDAERRVELRKRAAFLQRDKLQDADGMRLALVDALQDGEDPEALGVLADDAEARGASTESIAYLRRLIGALGGAAGPEISLRLAKLLHAEGDEAGALEQYEEVRKAHPENVDVLLAIGELQRIIGDEAASVETFRSVMPLVEGEQKLGVARSLGELLAGLNRPEEAVAAYKEVLSLDPEDLEAVERLATLAEAAEQWEDFAEYHSQLVEVEGDEQEASRMALKLSEVLSTNLERPNDALKALVPFARAGDEPCRDEYERLGDSLGRQGEVAESLVEWMKEAPAGPNRNRILRRAYDRFTQIADHVQAIEVGLELVRMKGASQELAQSLEETATTARNIEALLAAFVVLGRDVSGPPRAEEMVRQAEVLAAAGMEPAESVVHGEQALTSIAPGEVEPLLARLGEVAGGGASSVDVYARQVSRCKSAEDRTFALCRAAEVAAKVGESARVDGFLELALEAAGQAEGLDDLRVRVRRTDEANDSRDLREAFCSVLSGAGKGARDGGRSHSAYLVRAASVAHEDLGDADRGFELLGQALVAHADEESLEHLVAMGEAETDLTKVVRVIGSALEEVHDGPLVRMLLRCRFDLLLNRLDDPEGAGEDLKKLYDLSPADGDIASQLEAMYKDRNDTRGLVQLYEDQILRGRDQAVRGDLARKVAHIWQDILGEPREAADAWRRVLRMSSGDEEAKGGLAKAKLAMRTVSAKQIAASEEETRKEVEARRKLEEEQALRFHAEQEKKAEELKARHSNPPILDEPEVEKIVVSEAQSPEVEAASPPAAKVASPESASEADSTGGSSSDSTSEADSSSEQDEETPATFDAPELTGSDTAKPAEPTDDVQALVEAAQVIDESSSDPEPASDTKLSTTDTEQVAAALEVREAESESEQARVKLDEAKEEAKAVLDAIESQSQQVAEASSPDSASMKDLAREEPTAQVAVKVEALEVLEGASEAKPPLVQQEADIYEKETPEAPLVEELDSTPLFEGEQQEEGEQAQAPSRPPGPPPLRGASAAPPPPSAGGSVPPPPPARSGSMPPPFPSGLPGRSGRPPAGIKAPPLPPPSASRAASLPPPLTSKGAPPAPPGGSRKPPPPPVSRVPPPPPGGAQSKGPPPPPARRPPPPPPGRK